MQVLWFCLFLFSGPLSAQSEFEPAAEIDLIIDAQASDARAEEPTSELSEEEKAAERAKALEVSRQLALRSAAIENLQSDLGIYAPQLTELYADLAAYYVELEDYESAIQRYNDALQVARINTGLYSEEQRPIIRALVDTQSQLQAWDKVDQSRELDYFVTSRVYGPSDPEYLLAMEDYGKWKLRVVKENLLGLTSRGLLDTATNLSNFYGLTLEKIDAQNDVAPESMLGLISGKTETDLALARSIASTPSTAFAGTVNPYLTESRCQNRVNAQGQVVRQCVNVQVENPRYRQSQQDAKNMALRRYTRQIEDSVERLREIRSTSTILSEAEKLNLDSQIATLETETIQLQRAERRIFSF